MTSVHRTIKTIALCSLLLVFSACSKQSTTPTTSLPRVDAAARALFWSEQLMSENVTTTGPSRPSSLLGIYATQFLTDATSTEVSGAKKGVNAGISLLMEDKQTTDESFALLQSLGTVMQVDVQDMLNRSTDRQPTFDAYVDSLQGLLTQSETTQTRLKQQQVILKKDVTAKRSAVQKIQKSLNDALNKQDYSTASSMQQTIIDAQGELTKVDTEDKQLLSTIDIFGKLITVAKERLTAMKENREILIAGLHVVDVPGIDNLGLVKDQKNTRSTTTTSIFGN